MQTRRSRATLKWSDTHACNWCAPPSLAAQPGRQSCKTLVLGLATNGIRYMIPTWFDWQYCSKVSHTCMLLIFAQCYAALLPAPATSCTTPQHSRPHSQSFNMNFGLARVACNDVSDGYCCFSKSSIVWPPASAASASSMAASVRYASSAASSNSSSRSSSSSYRLLITTLVILRFFSGQWRWRQGHK